MVRMIKICGGWSSFRGSHYYIDGTVLDSGRIPVLMVDTEKDMYYRVLETGNWLILPYEEEN